jgi:Tol biopolymer transport system component
LITERDTERSEVAWFDRQGQRLQTVERLATATSHRWPELSPDDTIVAIDKLDPVVQTTDIHLLDLVRGTESSLTTDPALEGNARWSPDGTQVVFDSARDELPPNLFRKATTGGGREERLLKSSLVQHPTDWSRDGRFVAFSMLDRKTQWDLWMLPMNSQTASGERVPVPLLQTPFNEYNGRLSPDGRWMAYQSDESGVWEIYVREVATSTESARRQLSMDGGVWPVWRRDGRELFYMAADGTLMTVAVKLGRDLESSAPRALFKTKVAELWNPIRNYSVARDGQRFLINTRVDEASSPPITVTLNWPALRR